MWGEHQPICALGETDYEGKHFGCIILALLHMGGSN